MSNQANVRIFNVESICESGRCYAVKDDGSNSVRIYGVVSNTNNAIPINAAMFVLPEGFRPKAAGAVAVSIIENAAGVNYVGNSIGINPTTGEVYQAYSSTTKKVIFAGEFSV